MAEEIKNNLNSIKNLQITSLFFFFIIGIIHFSSGVFFLNNYFANISYIINNSFDIPFISAGIVYLLSSIKVFFIKHNYESKKADIALLSIGIIVFLMLIYFNLFTQDL